WRPRTRARARSGLLLLLRARVPGAEHREGVLGLLGVGGGSRGDRDPWLRAARPEAPDRAQPARVVERAGPQDAHPRKAGRLAPQARAARAAEAALLATPVGHR